MRRHGEHKLCRRLSTDKLVCDACECACVSNMLSVMNIFHYTFHLHVGLHTSDDDKRTLAVDTGTTKLKEEVIIKEKKCIPEFDYDNVILYVTVLFSYYY